ncbi:Gustatory receptor 159b [Halyomorpha halys]|nr:Gustatory receptor 159b [Halyomorpha halys]
MAKGVQNALSFVLAMSRPFGASVLRVQGWTYVFCYKLYSYLILLVTTTIAEGIIETSFLISLYSLSFLFIIESSVFWINTTTAVIVIYQHYQLREELPAIISDLECMDSLIGGVTYSGYYNYGAIILSIVTATPRIIAILLRPLSWNNVFMRVLYLFITEIPILIATQYAILLHILSRQLHTLSEQLDAVMFNIKVLSLIDVHQNLVLLAGRINTAFDTFLMYMITSIFVINISTLYFLIIYIMKPVSAIDLPLSIVCALSFLVNCGLLMLMVFPAMEATKNAELFNKQLLKSLLISKTIAQDEKIRTYLGMKHSIQQSACNFFSLDYHLLTSMAAGTTTYVILLVQFTLL